MTDSNTNQATPDQQADNDITRVTRWSFAPGAETGFHVHEMDYVVVPMLDGQLKIVSPEGEETVAELKAGQSYFRKAGVHHNVINANDYPFSFVEIEFK